PRAEERLTVNGTAPGARRVDAPAVREHQPASLAARLTKSDEFHGSHLEGHEAAVDRVVASRDEARGVGAEKQGQLGDLLRPSHAADRLRPGELLEHFPLPPGIALR